VSPLHFLVIQAHDALIIDCPAKFGGGLCRPLITIFLRKGPVDVFDCIHFEAHARMVDVLRAYKTTFRTISRTDGAMGNLAF
jgi:hypothetical protein